MSKSACRLCGSAELAFVTALRDLAISHRLRRDPGDPDPRFDVAFHHCRRCGLLQIVDPIDAAALYEETETYLTSFQRPAHVPDLLTTMLAHKNAGKVAEIGCNDGWLLARLAERGYEPVGVEPNRAAARLAAQAGFTVHEGFFGESLAGDMVAAHGRFDVVIARHVLEHVADIAGFFGAIDRLLAPDGHLVIELPYVEAGFLPPNPAILWEEHVSYYPEPLIVALLRAHGYAPFERRLYAFGGGAIAFLARRAQAEKADWSPGGFDAGFFATFAAGLDRYAAALRATVEAYRAAGWRIAMYGAAPRSCTVAAFTRIADRLDLVIDDRAEIWGLLMPGTALPIAPLDERPQGGAPILYLLGVGSENEGRVIRRVRDRMEDRSRFVSLFPPRDCVAGFESARALLSQATA